MTTGRYARLVRSLIVLCFAILPLRMYGAAGLPTLTRVRQLLQLSRSEANKRYPIKIRAVVTYYGPGIPDEHGADVTPDLFVADATGGVWVHVQNSDPAAAPGELIELSGVSEEPDFAPQVGNPHWRTIGAAPMPRTRQATFNEMISTRDDGQRVQVDGIVRTARIDPRSKLLMIKVAMTDGFITAQLPRYEGFDFQGLVDAKVRIQGNCGAAFNLTNQLIGIVLYVPDFGSIHILSPPPANPWERGAQALRDVQGFSSKIEAGHRVRVQGVVTAGLPDGSFYITDDTGSTYIRTN